MIYLVIGNHQTLSGVWEQVEITLRTFREMDVQIRIASRIQSGHINILIEDFNSHIVEEMSKVKVNNPDTHYVLYVTEYLTQNSNAHVTLNCFSRTSVWVRRLFRWEYKLLSDDYNMYQGGTKANQIKAKVRTLLEPLLSFCANLAGSNYGNEVMMARREACLDKIRGLFSLCISTTEAVLNGYDKYCDCPLKYLPVFIDKTRMYSNRSKSKKYPAIVFSGRMTHHRAVVSKHIGLKLLNGYPLEAGEAWKSLSQDTEFKLDRLELEETAYGKMEALRFSDELRQMELPSFEVLHTNIYQYTNKPKSAAYEIYLPQSAGWPYSSPNRTILSIESGLIPIDYGDFSDHDVNAVAIKATDTDELKAIVSRDLKLSYQELDSSVDKYNEGQGLKVPAVKASLLELSSNMLSSWDGMDHVTLGSKD